jgi:hypothetical protein
MYVGRINAFCNDTDLRKWKGRNEESTRFPKVVLYMEDDESQCFCVDEFVFCACSQVYETMLQFGRTEYAPSTGGDAHGGLKSSRVAIPRTSTQDARCAVRRFIR